MSLSKKGEDPTTETSILMRVTRSGSIVWSTELVLNNFRLDIKCTKVSQNGNILVAGLYDDLVGTLERASFFGLFDSNGNSIWVRSI